MGKLVGIVIGVAVLALWSLPVYVLNLASDLVDPREWREFKWSLRVAVLASIAIGAVAWRAPGPLIGKLVTRNFGQIVPTLA